MNHFSGIRTKLIVKVFPSNHGCSKNKTLVDLFAQKIFFHPNQGLFLLILHNLRQPIFSFALFHMYLFQKKPFLALLLLYRFQFLLA